MGLERDYQIKILSNQLNNYCSSSVNHLFKDSINPWFLTGITDAEGSFKVSMSKTEKRKLSWRIEPNFEITLHIKDHDLLVKFKNYLGGIGNIYLSKNKDIVTYIVSSKKDLEILIIHFNSFPLLSQKAADYQLFKKVFDLMSIKAHLNK